MMMLMMMCGWMTLMQWFVGEPVVRLGLIISCFSARATSQFWVYLALGILVSPC